MKSWIFFFLPFLCPTTYVSGFKVNQGVDKRNPLPNGESRSSAVSGSLRSEEVCQMEEFKASCDSDEVVVIRSAQLGRLKLGRCVKEEKYEVGCSLDVLFEMDRLCSGRRSCVVKVDDGAFTRNTNCHQDLKNHLWATYECVKVIVPPESCGAIREQSGILSNFVTETSRCGLTDSPWIVEVNRGQRVNVTLYDFDSGASQLSRQLSPSSPTGGNDGAYPQRCRVYATIREAVASGGVQSLSRTVCGGLNRVNAVFLSSGEKIEIRILTTRGVARPSGQQHDSVYFLLQFNAVGCADPSLSKDMWMKRLTGSPDTVTIGCDGSNLSWQLTCKINEWSGFRGNCSTDKAVSAAQGMPYAMSTMIVVIIAMTVSCVILTIGVICIKKRIVEERDVRCLRRDMRSQYDVDYGLGAIMSSDKLNLDGAIGGGGGGFDPSGLLVVDATGNEYARMRLQQQQQRLTADYAGSPSSYGFDVQSPLSASSYGTAGCEYRFPAVEHVYESPDSLRREAARAANGLYVPRVGREQQNPSPGAGGPGGAAVVGREIGGRPSSPRGLRVPLSPVQEAVRAGTPNTPSKTKNAGNYSL